MKWFCLLSVIICLGATLSMPQGLDDVGVFSFASSNRDDVVGLIDDPVEQPIETSFKTDKPDEGFKLNPSKDSGDKEKKETDANLKSEAFTVNGLLHEGSQEFLNTDEGSELNHSNDSSANEKKETDAELKPEAIRKEFLDEGWQEFFVTNPPVSPSKPSTNETEIVYVDDDEKVKKAENDLERNLEEFEEFEERAANASKSNDTKKIVDAPKKEIIKKTDLEDTKSFEENSFENEDELMDDPLIQTGDSYKTTEASDVHVLTPMTPSPRSIPMDDSNAVKEDEDEWKDDPLIQTGVSYKTTEASDVHILTPVTPSLRLIPIDESNAVKEGEDEWKDEDLMETGIPFKTTEASDVHILTPVTPSPRLIPIDDSNAVKEGGTPKVTENEISSTTTEFSVSKFTPFSSQERPPPYLVKTTSPVGDTDAAKDAESPKLLSTEVYAKPTESSTVRFTASEPIVATPRFMSTPILEATLNADFIENTINSTLPSDEDLKIGTAKIDLDADDTSSSHNSSTIHADKVPEESKETNLPEDLYSLSNDLKKNKFSTDTDFHVVESATENQEIERVAEVNDTLLNETIVSENSSEVICPKGYRCIPLNHTSKEVCLALIHVYIFSGAIATFLLVLLVGLVCKLRCRKKSSSLYDIPHLNIKSDYNLTPIPRPSINHHDREFPSFSSESYSRSRGEESVLNPRHFNTSVPNEFMESKSLPRKSKLHTFGRSGSKKSEANSSCNEYYSLDTWKDKEPLRNQGADNLAFRHW